MTSFPQLAQVGRGVAEEDTNQYSRIRAVEALDKEIENRRAAIDATPAGRPDVAACLSNLSAYLIKRYSTIGAMDDLDEAIQKHKPHWMRLQLVTQIL